MIEWFNKLISSNSALSSARFLNIYGSIIVTGLLIADFITNKHLNTDVMYAFMAYCGGVYGISTGMSAVQSNISKGNTNGSTN